MIDIDRTHALKLACQFKVQAHDAGIKPNTVGGRKAEVMYWLGAEHALNLDGKTLGSGRLFVLSVGRSLTEILLKEPQQ